MSCLCREQLTPAQRIWEGRHGEVWGSEASEMKLRGPGLGGAGRTHTASCINAFAQRDVFELRLYFKGPAILLTNTMLEIWRIKALDWSWLAHPPITPQLAGAWGAWAQCAQCDFSHPQPFTITASFSHPLPHAPQPLRISFIKSEHLAPGKGRPVIIVNIALKARMPPKPFRRALRPCCWGLHCFVTSPIHRVTAVRKGFFPFPTDSLPVNALFPP